MTLLRDRRAGAGGNYDCADLYCEPPDTALHSGSVAPRLGRTTISRMTRKKQDRSRSGRLLAQRAGIAWGRPLGTQESPERPFPISIESGDEPASLQSRIRPFS